MIKFRNVYTDNRPLNKILHHKYYSSLYWTLFLPQYQLQTIFTYYSERQKNEDLTSHTAGSVWYFLSLLKHAHHYSCSYLEYGIRGMDTAVPRYYRGVRQ